MNELKIAAIGGGTGLSTMLKGLKLHTRKITAIVSVADDGGSSGILRNDMGMLPPGDVRNCIAALIDMDEQYAELLNYRFREGVFEGHTVGNMLLAAINENSDNFDEAVPAFFAGIFMALCYSISYGIAAGFIFYCITKICKKEAGQIHPILWVATILFILNFVLLAVI